MNPGVYVDAQLSTTRFRIPRLRCMCRNNDQCTRVRYRIRPASACPFRLEARRPLRFRGSRSEIGAERNALDAGSHVSLARNCSSKRLHWRQSSAWCAAPRAMASASFRPSASRLASRLGASVPTTASRCSSSRPSRRASCRDLSWQANRRQARSLPRQILLRPILLSPNCS